MDINISDYLEDLDLEGLKADLVHQGIDDKLNSKIEIDGLSSIQISNNLISFRNELDSNYSLKKKIQLSLLAINHTKYLGLYTLNTNFNFVQNTVEPIEHIGDIKKIYDIIEQKNILKEILRTKSYREDVIHHPDSNEELFVSVLPLITIEGFYGILILVSKEKTDITLLEAIQNFCDISAADLLSVKLKKANSNIVKEQDQIIKANTVELHNSKRQLSAIIDTVQAGIVLADRNSKKIINVNPFAEELSNYKPIDIEKDVFLNDIFDSYTVSFGQLPSTLITKGGRKISVIRNSSIVKLPFKEIIVETFIDISFVSTITDNYKTEIDKLQINKSKTIETLEKNLDIYKKRVNDIIYENRDHGDNAHLDILSEIANINAGIRDSLLNIITIYELIKVSNPSIIDDSFIKYDKIYNKSIGYITTILDLSTIERYDDKRYISDIHLINQHILKHELKDREVNISCDINNQNVRINQQIYTVLIRSLLNYLLTQNNSKIDINIKMSDDSIILEFVSDNLKSDPMNIYMRGNSNYNLFNYSLKLLSGKINYKSINNGKKQMNISLPIHSPIKKP
jgi:PAS domain-containing protein